MIEQTVIAASIRSFINGLSHDNLKDGQVVMMPPMGSHKYMFFLKDNTSDCLLSLNSMDENGMMGYLLHIVDFADPNINEEQVASTPKSPLLLGRDYRIDLGGKPSSLKQTHTSCGPPVPIIFNTKHIKYLSIRDIKILTHLGNVVAASDFIYGILFWRIDMDESG